MRVLVTGATGLVGDELMRVLAQRDGVEAVGIARGRQPSRQGVLAWDIGSEPAPSELGGRWDVLIHAAADVRWTLPSETAMSANVDTVAALEPLVCPDTHVVHISTAYATGLRGEGASERLEDYRNTYEWSKAAAERLARRIFPRVTIVRPPLIIGRREDGHAARFAGMYTVLRGIASSVVPAIVGIAHAPFDVVPVDDLVQAIVGVSAKEPQAEPVVVAGGRAAPQVEVAMRWIFDSFNEWRVDRGLSAFDAPRIVSPESWERFLLPFAKDHLTSRQLRVLELLANFHPYMAVEEPLSPTYHVGDVQPAVEASVAYWASVNESLASQEPRPWRPASQEATDSRHDRDLHSEMQEGSVRR